MINRRILLALAIIVLGMGACRTPSDRALDQVDAAAGPPHLLLGFAPTVNGPEAYWKYVNLEGTKASYTLSFQGNTFLNGVSFGVSGSATKVVKITRIKIGPSVSTAVGKQTLTFAIQDPAPTGGSPLTLAGFRFDSADPTTSSANALLYGSAPTTCASGAGCTRNDLIRSDVIFSAAATPTFQTNTIEMKFCGGPPQKCPTLRSATAIAEVLTSPAIAGQSVPFDIDWTEE